MEADREKSGNKNDIRGDSGSSRPEHPVSLEGGGDHEKNQTTGLDECNKSTPVASDHTTSYDEVLRKFAGLDLLNVPKSTSPKLSSETVPNPIKQTYNLKWILWNGKRTAIVTQNENGPCPLIAIANILLLRGKITIPTNVTAVSAKNLLEFIGDAIVDNMPKGMRTETELNYEQNMHDAISLLPHLPTGLDVNVKFTGVSDFEYTRECIIFDLLNIPLYHGWLVDPEAYETVAALGNFGYNQIVERIITNKASFDADLVTEALIAEDFLERTASQLTYHGLWSLITTMEQEELAVLFRNNHFSTVLKKKDELFLLVTDEGFLHEPRVVWETLCDIDGCGQFVDSQFATLPEIPSETYLPEDSVSKDQQISHDYLVALSLQEEQKQQQEDKEQAWEEFKQAQPVSANVSEIIPKESLVCQAGVGLSHSTESEACVMRSSKQQNSEGEEVVHQLTDVEDQQQPPPPCDPQEAEAEQPSNPANPQPLVERSKKGMCTVL